MNPMTPIQALQILDQATSIVQVNRADHQRIIEALKVLNDVVNPPEKDNGG